MADSTAPTAGEAPPADAAPETAAPETAAPETAASETAAPETTAPASAAPETVAPSAAAGPESAPVPKVLPTSTDTGNAEGSTGEEPDLHDPKALVAHIMGAKPMPVSQNMANGFSNSQPAPSEPRLFVGNFPFDTLETTVLDHFKRFGVETVHLARDHVTGQSKGYAFVSFKDIQGATDALRMMPGTEIDGRPIRVSHASKRRPPLSRNQKDDLNVKLHGTRNPNMLMRAPQGTQLKVNERPASHPQVVYPHQVPYGQPPPNPYYAQHYQQYQHAPQYQPNPYQYMGAYGAAATAPVYGSYGQVMSAPGYPQPGAAPAGTAQQPAPGGYSYGQPAAGQAPGGYAGAGQ